MQRLIITICIITCLYPGIQSQDYAGFNQVDAETYRLYQAKQWDSLIVAGKAGLDQGIDYYYLRMRMGIAFYEKANYRTAASHFTAALKLNQDDPVALEYLYYARLFSGQKEQARILRHNFEGELAQYLPPSEKRFTQRIGIEYLYNKGLNDQIVENYKDYFSGLPPGVQFLTRNFSNSGVNLTHSFKPGISLFHAYTYLFKTNFYYYNDGYYEFAVDNQQVYQNQYYISPRFTTSNGFVFIPAFHLLNIHYQTPVSIIIGPQGESIAKFEFQTVNDYVGGLAISKDLGLFDLYLGGSYASLNRRKQYQGRLGFTCFPMGNLDLYAGGYVNSQLKQNKGKGIIRIIPEILIGAGISGKVWIELQASAGDMHNYIEKNGFIVYNSFSDIIEKKVKINLTVPISDKGSFFYLGGRWTANRSEYFAFDKSSGEAINNISYNSLAIYGGLSWKF